MNFKILVLAASVFLAAGMPSTATADFLEITFSGTVADGSNDLTNVFGFGTGNVLNGRAATGMLRINLATAPPGILNKPSAGMNYFDADWSQTTWKIPGYSWIESSLSIDGHAAPDLVPGTSSYENMDYGVLADGGASDGWSFQDWAVLVLSYPDTGQSIDYEDALALQIYNADFLSGLGLNQEFTLSGAPLNFAGVGTFRYGLSDSTVPGSYVIFADGAINITSVTAKLLKGSSGSYDFNGDGKPDILWRNVSTGENYVWYMDGVTVLAGGNLPTVADQNWKIVGVADFNNDGRPDILWRNGSTGENYVWYLDGVLVLAGGNLPTVTDQNWKIVAVADFNNDGKPDILWRNISTGENYIWYLDGVSFQSGGSLPAVPDQDWKVVGVADFNNDGKPDILWRHAATGQNYVWCLDGLSVLTGIQLLPVAEQDWKIVRVGDLNNDGKPDILWRHAATGENYIWYMDGVSFQGGGNLPTVADQSWTLVR